MRELLHGMIKLLGFSDCGLLPLLYSFYLKKFKKLPYSIEMTLKPEAKERYIQIESTCLLLYFVLIVSLTIFLIVSHFNRIAIIIPHVSLMLIVFCFQVFLKKDLYK